MPGMEGVEGHGSPFWGVKGVLRLHTATAKGSKVWHDPGMYTTAGTARCGARRHRQRAIRFSLDDSLLSPTPLRPSRAVWPAAVRGPSHARVAGRLRLESIFLEKSVF